MTINTDIYTFRLPEPQKILNLAVDFFNRLPLHSLPPGSFKGTGVYALYYTGSFELYASLSAHNKEKQPVPMYVGKAVGKGWRTARTTTSNKTELANRLREHSHSIRQTTHLSIDDFLCRFMIMTDDEASFIPAVEAELIRRYHPLWNSVIDGFGNHDPGDGRYNQAVSEWDALHQGRPWVIKLTGAKPDSNIITAKVRQHLERLAALPDDIQEEADAAQNEHSQQ